MRNSLSCVRTLPLSRLLARPTNTGQPSCGHVGGRSPPKPKPPPPWPPCASAWGTRRGSMYLSPGALLILGIILYFIVRDAVRDYGGPYVDVRLHHTPSAVSQVGDSLDRHRPRTAPAAGRRTGPSPL